MCGCQRKELKIRSWELKGSLIIDSQFFKISRIEVRCETLGCKTDPTQGEIITQKYLAEFKLW